MSEIKLRPYQEEAVNRLLWSQNLEGNDLVSIPTAGGKTIVISKVADELRTESVILCPNREILSQNHEKLARYIPEEEIGVYSASFKRKDVNKFTLVTIQSAYKVPELFTGIKLIYLDEAHLLNHRNDDGMLKSFIDAVGNPKVIGLTATPFRNVVGKVKTPTGGTDAVTKIQLINRMYPLFWNRLMYNLNTEDLLADKYVSPIQYERRTFIDQYKIPTNRSKSDFDLEAFARFLTPYEEQMCDEIAKQSRERHAVLVFNASVEQAERMAKILKFGDVVTGMTPTKERDRIIREFKEGKIKVVFNVGCLTTGFDFPELDTIVLIRPTRSLNLYQQMLGRILRIAPNKTEGLIIDFTDTVNKLGKIEDIKIVKEAGKWELYANGEKFHNKAIFSYAVKAGKNSRLIIGGIKR